MTNLEVAKELVHNALAYGESDDMETVMENLEEIAELLEVPNLINHEYDWEDFK